uniref:RING-type domain-containing protein n=1 Tax=Phasianus colchicus TaxID=9054 RepID=A0A669Q363_PHACC
VYFWSPKEPKAMPPLQMHIGMLFSTGNRLYKKPDACVVPCEHHFCLRCILQRTLRKFTCPLCRRLTCTIRFSVRADGSLPCVITLPSEYEAESHDAAALWDIAAPHPAPSGSPAGRAHEELPDTSHAAPGDAAARPAGTPGPGDAEEPRREPAAGPSAQDRRPLFLHAGHKGCRSAVPNAVPSRPAAVTTEPNSALPSAPWEEPRPPRGLPSARPALGRTNPGISNDPSPS